MVHGIEEKVQQVERDEKRLSGVDPYVEKLTIQHCNVIDQTPYVVTLPNTLTRAAADLRALNGFSRQCHNR
jgi:hypothetical protein